MQKIFFDFVRSAEEAEIINVEFNIQGWMIWEEFTLKYTWIVRAIVETNGFEASTNVVEPVKWGPD